MEYFRQDISLSGRWVFRRKNRVARETMLILQLLKAKLDGLKYDYELFPGIISLADSIREEIKEKLKLNRYKFIVQVTLGEQKGQGVKASCRCYWDADADNYAEVTYFNERIFCVAVAFGIYNY
ncbi:unnamed protein product [Schistocephalus solidus]|uniref:Tctex1 domain-containing protein 2 n=1 Tax=Schistocephalus solidus TaxID=70667 RepID=A0A183SXU3_SCHSO|nr:unnamed protein product [Schistocephalus solidus]